MRSTSTFPTVIQPIRAPRDQDTESDAPAAFSAPRFFGAGGGYCYLPARHLVVFANFETRMALFAS